MVVGLLVEGCGEFAVFDLDCQIHECNFVSRSHRYPFERCLVEEFDEFGTGVVVVAREGRIDVPDSKTVVNEAAEEGESWVFRWDEDVVFFVVCGVDGGERRREAGAHRCAFGLDPCCVAELEDVVRHGNGKCFDNDVNFVFVVNECTDVSLD